MKIRLEPVTVASRAAVERLETAPGQEGFVESVAECLAEADRRRCWRPVGVYDGDALIGFAMYGFFWEYLPFGRLWLDRLLIDRRFQGRGYGRAALAALLDQSYWILGSVIGAVAGALIPLSTEGVDFAMTALFVVIAVDQWRSYRRHLPAVLGAGGTVLFLIVLGHFFGQDQMLLISLGVIVLCLLVLRDRLDEKEEETC